MRFQAVGANLLFFNNAMAVLVCPLLTAKASCPILNSTSGSFSADRESLTTETGVRETGIMSVDLASSPGSRLI